MADNWKVAGQINPGAASLTTLYTVPTGKSFVGHVVAANRSTTLTFIRISIAPSGAADATNQYIAYDLPVTSNNVYQSATFALSAGDVIRVYTDGAVMSFSAFGVEK
jgi:hypothetical protein